VSKPGNAKPQPAVWRLFLPLVPWAVIATVLSLVLGHWGLGWVPWAVLGILVVGALVIENTRR
jgi:hypothetical protein